MAGLVRPSTSLMLRGFQDVDARDKRGHDGATGDAAGITGRKAKLRPIPENPDGSAETKPALRVSDSFRRPPTAARAISRTAFTGQRLRFFVGQLSEHIGRAYHQHAAFL